eukprot:tig00001056_g6623.t1
MRQDSAAFATPGLAPLRGDVRKALGANGSIRNMAPAKAQSLLEKSMTAALLFSDARPARRCSFAAARSSGISLAKSFVGTAVAQRQAKPAVAFQRTFDVRCEAADGAAAAGGAPDVPGGKVDINDPALKSKYSFWRYRVFFGLLLGYTASYLTRGCFTYCAPLLRSELGMTLEQIGLITSIFPIAYGTSKFASGVIADLVSPKQFLALGLILTGILNLVFTLRPDPMWMSIVWGITGWISAFGGPSCAKLLTVWFSQNERGTWWGLWNCSHNLGGFLVAIVAGFAAQSFGWRAGMIVPGLIGIATGLAFLWAVKDDPSEVGLPPIDVFRQDFAVKPKAADGEVKVEAPVAKKSSKDIVFKYVLANPAIWLLALSYFFVYFIRAGVTNWSHFYIMDVKGVTDAAEAATRVSGREIGGLLGSLSAGFISDKLLGGKRIPVVCAFLVGIAASCFGLMRVPANNPFLDWLAVFFIGFFLYGPQMMIGLVGTELTHKSAASTATGFLGWIAYIGAMVAGAPLTIIVKQYGWNFFFYAMFACCAVPLLLLAPLWNKKSYADVVGVEKANQ